MLNSDVWYDEGIVLKGTKTGAVELLPEPYSLASAMRVAQCYASLWSEPIEWWPAAPLDAPRHVVEPARWGKGRRHTAIVGW